MDDSIALEVLALFVECPECGAAGFGGDPLEACWNVDGTDREPPHPERLKCAREDLKRARRISAEVGSA